MCLRNAKNMNIFFFYRNTPVCSFVFNSMPSSVWGITLTVCWPLISLVSFPLWIGYSCGARQWTIWKLSYANSQQQRDMWRYVCSSAMQMTAPHCVFMGNSKCCKMQKISRGACVHGMFLISTLFPICQSLAFSICPPIFFFFFWNILSERLNMPLIQLLYHHVTFLGYGTRPWPQKNSDLWHPKNDECPIHHVFHDLENVIHNRQQSRWHLIMDRS